MKVTTVALSLFAASLTTTVFAQNLDNFQSVLQNEKTAPVFQSMLGKVAQPEWLAKDATTTPAMKASIGGKEFTVFYSCKAHDCSSEQMAVMYNAADNVMYGVISTSNEAMTTQDLIWLNLENGDDTIDSKTILFAALSGSLDNHPDAFNYK